jgi:hypothetical protein
MVQQNSSLLPSEQHQNKCKRGNDDTFLAKSDQFGDRFPRGALAKGTQYADLTMTFAASAASIEEQANSAARDGKFPDGTKSVEVERRIWRAKVKPKYIEPETDIDPSEDLDYLYENAGKMLLERNTTIIYLWV